jgi:hypothetical protein
MRDVLAAFKQKLRDGIYTFADLSFREYGKRRGGKKGNITLTSFDGKYRLIVATDGNIVFDERLQAAREIIGGYLDRRSGGARPEIRLLVGDAFQAGKAGKISMARVLGLRRFEIQDPKWRKAMRAVTESIQVSGSKQYLRFYERIERGEYGQIALDVAAL